jgi:hypothetical protein
VCRGPDNGTTAFLGASLSCRFYRSLAIIIDNTYSNSTSLVTSVTMPASSCDISTTNTADQDQIQGFRRWLKDSPARIAHHGLRFSGRARLPRVGCIFRRWCVTRLPIEVIAKTLILVRDTKPCRHIRQHCALIRMSPQVRQSRTPPRSTPCLALAGMKGYGMLSCPAETTPQRKHK